jgi:TPR repeat protein
MKQVWCLLVLMLNILMAQEYAKQIKVVDECARLTEPLTIEKMMLKGITASKMDIVRSRKACEESLKRHPDDPHIRFLLARAYAMGAKEISGAPFPEEITIRIKELNGIKPDHAHAFALAKESCRQGDTGGCMLLGEYYRSAKFSKRDPKKAYLLWLWSCTKGNPQACQNLSGIIDRSGAYSAKDNLSANRLSIDACLSGIYPRACDYLSDHWFRIEDEFKQDTKLKKYVDFHACIHGSSNACYFLFKNEDNRTLQTKAKPYVLKYACNNGNAKACSDAGTIYMNSGKNRINTTIAEGLFEEGCNLGDFRWGCWYAGVMKLSEQGVYQNIPLGIKYLEKACYTGNNSFACYDLASFYLGTKEDKYKDRKKALRLLKKACLQGNGHAMYLGCNEGVESCCQK